MNTVLAKSKIPIFNNATNGSSIYVYLFVYVN